MKISDEIINSETGQWRRRKGQTLQLAEMSVKNSKISEFLKKTKGLDIDLPDIEPDEPAVTKEQVEEIGKLTDHILPDEKIVTLGKWQAAYVIYKLKEAEIFYFLAAENEAEKSKHKLAKIVIAVSLLIFLALFVLSFLMKKN